MHKPLTIAVTPILLPRHQHSNLDVVIFHVLHQIPCLLQIGGTLGTRSLLVESCCVIQYSIQVAQHEGVSIRLLFRHGFALAVRHVFIIVKGGQVGWWFGEERCIAVINIRRDTPFCEKPIVPNTVSLAQMHDTGDSMLCAVNVPSKAARFSRRYQINQRPSFTISSNIRNHQ